MDKFWIVMKTDGAIGGHVRGTQSRETIDGPFDDFDKALDAKPRSHGCTYYTVEESETKPKDESNEYEFVDADREFDDV